MKTFWETLLVAFGMYSRVPTKQIAWTEDNRRYAMLAFPLVGVVQGALFVLVAFLGSLFQLPALLKAAFLTGVPLLVAGGIHMDGYADTCDALASHGDRERKLAIMKDPHTGSFAVVHVVLYYLFFFAACTVLAEAEPAVWLVAGLAFVVSRTLSGLSVATFPFAKNTGLVKAFADDADKTKVRNGLRVVLTVLAVLLVGIDLATASLPAGLFTCFAALCMFFWYKYVSTKQFGGITGDLAGWFLCRAELFMLVAAALAVSLTGGVFS